MRRFKITYTDALENENSNPEKLWSGFAKLRSNRKTAKKAINKN